MQQLFERLSATELRIKDLDRQYNGIEDHPFYQIYNRAEEKKKDKEILRLALRDQLTLKQVLLENIQLEINKGLQLVSQNQREISLKKLN